MHLQADTLSVHTISTGGRAILSQKARFARRNAVDGAFDGQ
jgi:hypothetical protein